MKKLFYILFVSIIFASCIKKKETTSTEAENLQEDVKDIKRDVKDYKEERKDSVGQDIKQNVKAEDGFEGQKSQY